MCDMVTHRVPLLFKVSWRAAAAAWPRNYRLMASESDLNCIVENNYFDNYLHNIRLIYVVIYSKAKLFRSYRWTVEEVKVDNKRKFIPNLVQMDKLI